MITQSHSSALGVLVDGGAGTAHVKGSAAEAPPGCTMHDESSAFDLEESALPPAKILAIDDLQANLLAVSAVLEPLGHRIVEATSGAAALEAAARDEFAVILLDIMMPEMDGFETLVRLRTVPLARHTPVIFLTAYDLDPRMVERAYALGAVDYVPKPITPLVLRGKVSALVSLYRRGKEIRNRGAALAAKDRHIAMLAHDLRNPLASILTLAKLLERNAADDKTRHRADRIGRAAERMDHMVQDLLDYARARADAIPITPAEMDLGELCRELAEELELADPDREIEIETAGDLTGVWDRPRLYQAISNLAGNAIRYGGGRAAIRARRVEDHVEVSVHNDGPAIEPELLPVIFEPFERGDREGRGLGLGLYIVREIIQAHGGRVSVDSSDRSGTIFVLTLPGASGSHQLRGAKSPPTLVPSRTHELALSHDPSGGRGPNEHVGAGSASARGQAGLEGDPLGAELNAVGRDGRREPEPTLDHPPPSERLPNAFCIPNIRASEGHPASDPGPAEARRSAGARLPTGSRRNRRGDPDRPSAPVPTGHQSRCGGQGGTCQQE